MRINRIVVTWAVSALIASSALALDTYKVDPAHSSVNFSIDHMVVNFELGIRTLPFIGISAGYFFY